MNEKKTFDREEEKREERRGSREKNATMSERVGRSHVGALSSESVSHGGGGGGGGGSGVGSGSGTGSGTGGGIGVSHGGHRIPTPGEMISELVRDILVREKRMGGGGGELYSSSRSRSSQQNSLVLKLLSRIREAREDVEHREKHFLNRKEKILAELNRLAERGRRKDDTEERQENIVKAFENIELRVERVSQLASHEGDRLVKLEKRRNFAKESKDLLGHFSSFSKAGDDLQGIPHFFTSDKHVFEAAATAIKLRTLGEKLLVGSAAGVGVGVGDNTQLNSSPVRKRNELAAIIERIQVYCDKLENRLIQNFDKALRHKNYSGMRECAKSLLLFQGGGRLISHYLGSRPIFLETNPKTFEDEAASVLETQGSKHLLDLLGRWYKHSLESVKKERVIINEVFPNADQLTEKLVQRLFEQNVQTYLNAVLIPSRERTLESLNNEEVQGFLRNIAAAYEKTRELALGLQTIGCTGIDVDSLANELFNEHLQNYPKIEFELSEAMYLSQRSQNQGKELNYDVIQQYFLWAKESIGRCMLLCIDQDRVESVQKLFSSNSSRYASSFSLLDQVYQYMIGGLQAAMDSTDKACGSLSVFSLSNEADLEVLNEKIVGTSLNSIFTIVNTLTTCVVEFQNSVSEGILEGLSPESLRDKCRNSLMDFVAFLETSVAQALSFGISNCLQVFGKVMKARQTRGDFCPQDDEIGMGGIGKVTTACTIAVKCVRSVHDASVFLLGEPNVLPFMNEFGECIFHTLKQHFGSFHYNPQGALRLKRDLAEYADVFKAVGATSVGKSFDDLSEQANLLVVMPDSIPDLVSEDLKISNAVVLFWIKLREDYKTARIGGDGQTFDSLFAK